VQQDINYIRFFKKKKRAREKKKKKKRERKNHFHYHLVKGVNSKWLYQINHCLHFNLINKAADLHTNFQLNLDTTDWLTEYFSCYSPQASNVA
jgi:hypothetical protein